MFRLCKPVLGDFKPLPVAGMRGAGCCSSGVSGVRVEIAELWGPRSRRPPSRKVDSQALVRLRVPLLMADIRISRAGGKDRYRVIRGGYRHTTTLQLKGTGTSASDEFRYLLISFTSRR